MLCESEMEVAEEEGRERREMRSERMSGLVVIIVRGVGDRIERGVFTRSSWEGDDGGGEAAMFGW